MKYRQYAAVRTPTMLNIHSHTHTSTQNKLSKSDDLKIKLEMEKMHSNWIEREKHKTQKIGDRALTNMISVIKN